MKWELPLQNTKAISDFLIAISLGTYLKKTNDTKERERI